LGVGQILAAKLDIFVEQFLGRAVGAVGARHDDVAGGHALGLGLIRRHGRVNQVEFEARGLADQFLEVG